MVLAQSETSPVVSRSRPRAMTWPGAGRACSTSGTACATWTPRRCRSGSSRPSRRSSAPTRPSARSSPSTCSTTCADPAAPGRRRLRLGRRRLPHRGGGPRANPRSGHCISQPRPTHRGSPPAAGTPGLKFPLLVAEHWWCRHRAGSGQKARRTPQTLERGMGPWLSMTSPSPAECAATSSASSSSRRCSRARPSGSRRASASTPQWTTRRPTSPRPATGAVPATSPLARTRWVRRSRPSRPRRRASTPSPS